MPTRATASKALFAALLALGGSLGLTAASDEGDPLATRGALAADAPLAVYAADLADIRNRLHHALFTSTLAATEDLRAAAPVTRIEGGPRATIAWGAERGPILSDPRHADVLSLLERALEDRSLRAQSALHRVLLQHDLWTAHDALFARRKTLAEPLAAARCDQMILLLARLVARLAPRADEIDTLPAPPLPVAIAGGKPRADAAPTHAAMAGGRVTATILDLPGGGAGGGTALVTRLVAIDSKGEPRATAIPARVDARLGAEGVASSFVLDRAALLASPFDPRVLALVAPDTPTPELLSPARSGASPRGPIVFAPLADRCAACHARPTAPLLDPLPKTAGPEFASIREAFSERENR